MAHYNYTPSKQIDIQNEMSRALLNQPINKHGRRTTSIGSGLAHMLRQYQGGKMRRDAASKTEENERNQQENMARLLASRNPMGGQDQQLSPGGLVSDLGASRGPAQLETYTDPNTRNLNAQLRLGDQDAARDQRNKLELQQAKGAGGYSPYKEFLSTAEHGILVGDKRSGLISKPKMPLTKAQHNAQLQGDIAQAREAGKTTGKTITDRTLNADAIVASYDAILDAGTKLLSKEHEGGFNAAFGAIEGWVPTLLPGTQNAEAYVQQIADFISVEARQKMQGSGAISDFEARMLASSATILGNRKISHAQAREEVEKVLEILKGARARAAKYKKGSGVSQEEEANLMKLYLE